MSRVSLHQFFHENKLNGENVLWPAAGGIPFVGNEIPDLQGDQIDELPVRMVFRSGLFNIWDEEHKKRFDDVCNHILSGVWSERHRAERWVTEGLQVWLEWAEVYKEAPVRRNPRGMPEL